MKRRLLLMPLILMISALMGCQTIQPPNSTLKAMQEWATPEPPDRVSPPHEHAREKAAMVRWLEKRFKHEYRVVGQHFVLLEPGFTQGASIGSKAHQYVTYTLGGQVQTDGWFGDENYRLILWKFNDGRERYLGFVIKRDFLPGTDEQTLVGYLELEHNENGHLWGGSNKRRSVHAQACRSLGRAARLHYCPADTLAANARAPLSIEKSQCNV